jgi:hypothetical protein
MSLESVNHNGVAIGGYIDYLLIPMGSVREMLLARKQEIGTKVAPLFSESTRLRKALIENESAISVLHGELKQIDTALKALDDADAKRKPITIMEAVLEILRHKPAGMTAQEILAELNEKYFAWQALVPATGRTDVVRAKKIRPRDFPRPSPGAVHTGECCRQSGDR